MSEIHAVPEYQEDDFDMVFDALTIYRRPGAQGYTLSEASAIWRGMRRALMETRGYSVEDLAQLQRHAEYVLNGIEAMERGGRP